ncbi:GlxA family transcriptional regulator [Embleya hyalina]|uniref:AraC family transcriptional regulator n=1 Tax=Embleya hyalina TaxID=516124 RepID=A0A401YJ22_9ACTN|nr:helix-turn-helix domain-containing protein [Embleya hyalina]GCD94577.1 AraC family transcriptional regulator [Embleya hyalina]
MSVVAVLALDGVPGHQLTTPGLVFGAAERDHRGVAYEVRICSGPGPRTIAGPAGPRIGAPYGLDALADADVVLIPGHDGYRDAPPAGVVPALRAVARRGGRIAAVDTGTFTLAATGLLNGRRATTNRRRTDELAELYPDIDVDPLGIAIEDGPFLTAAGVFGGMDVCLRLLAHDHGRRVADATSRELITPLHVYADDVQETIARQVAATVGLEPTLRWMRAHLHDPLTLADLAAHARTGAGSLTRRFRAHTGLSPLQYLLRMRLEEAQRMLRETDIPVEEIAYRAGFVSPVAMRRHFRALTDSTPRAYRSAHRAAGDRPARRLDAD